MDEFNYGDAHFRRPDNPWTIFNPFVGNYIMDAFGGGWLISKNVLTKLEYMKQNYNGNTWTGRFAGALFNGVKLEAVISF